MIMMLMLLLKHFGDLLLSKKVFPFISLVLTPLIILHVFTIEVKLAEVIKLQIKYLF